MFRIIERLACLQVCKIKYLKLPGSNFTKSGVQNLTDNLKLGNKLMVLDLTDCKLDDDSLEILGQLFAHVKELILRNNSFTW